MASNRGWTTPLYGPRDAASGRQLDDRNRATAEGRERDGGGEAEVPAGEHQQQLPGNRPADSQAGGEKADRDQGQDEAAKERKRDEHDLAAQLRQRSGGPEVGGRHEDQRQVGVEDPDRRAGRKDDQADRR